MMTTSEDHEDATGSWFLYCDEAGNAGSNYWDREQPFHVSAGWLVRPTAHERFISSVQHAVAAGQTGEMKGSVLIKRPAGQRRISNLFSTLGAQVGALPFYIIAERRFCVAGKAVEVFLDPYTNPAASWLPTSAVDERQEVWETVSELPDAALVPFVTAYREPSVDGFREALCVLVHALQRNGQRRLAATFNSAHDHLAGTAAA